MLRPPSGVAVQSTTESGGCSGSDITEPCSPLSPESSCSAPEEPVSSGGGASARMPPWALEPAPPPRRLAAQPAPTRRPHPPAHRRITEFFNHKMKPQNGIKRDNSAATNDDTKRKCLPKNGVTHDLEKYISYLSQTLSPKVLMDVEKQANAARKPMPPTNGTTDATKSLETKIPTSSNTVHSGLLDFCKPRDSNEKVHTTMNGFVEIRHDSDAYAKNKIIGGLQNGLTASKKHSTEMKTSPDPSANGLILNNKQPTEIVKGKVPIPAAASDFGLRIAPATSTGQQSRKFAIPRTDPTRMNGVVSSTTKLDSRMNGVTCGSNNLTLNPVNLKPMPLKREVTRKAGQSTKRTNRKSSACIANSKNLTWSKANNLKQVQQKCANANTSQAIKALQPDANGASKLNLPNGVRQVSMTVNRGLNNLNVPVTNLQNCQQINIQPQCNGSVTSNNLASFVAVPQNVMLTALRIPQNGIQTQTLTQHNNIAAFNRPNVNVSSPTKLNGQFMLPLVQNINGTVVQIPNLMAKMPNFVLPQPTPRQDHLQNQQTAQILFNGTLLKLANTMPSTYPNMNKPGAVSSQPISVMSKNVTGLTTVGMSVQSKTNYAVNQVLVPQPGFIVTSVPNISVKETWSYTGTNTVSSSQTTCSNPIVQHSPPAIANFTTHALHTSSIPMAPVKPPDNPIQGTDPPSSTVKEPEVTNPKCDIPWLSKTVNNNLLTLDTNIKTSRPFAEISSLSEKLAENARMDKCIEVEKVNKETDEELRKAEEVARREETIFTQITVLKDVSCDVQSTVIEANFCSTSIETESGIGTDKSIDSPSDSRASKECDEDSSLSLSVSISSVEAPSQKSPILKQPKTIRFPPKCQTKPDSDQRTSSTDTTTTVTVCLWENCKKEFDGDSELIEHLQNVHVETQAGKENYVCLWEQCKVRGKPSCSRLWLERHALSHGGNKPFKCIFDGCTRRFSTQILLGRHVNNHFNEASPNSGTGKKAADSSAKLIRRNGKKLRYRRQPWSARMFDFFDSGTMEGLSWRLMRCTRWRLGGASPLREPPGIHTLTLRATLTATRYNATQRTREALLTYYPPHVLEDEWVPEKDVKRVKRVEISQLPVHIKVLLYEQFCASYKKAPPPPPESVPQCSRKLPPRTCTSSRLLNNLIAKQKIGREESNTAVTSKRRSLREESSSSALVKRKSVKEECSTSPVEKIEKVEVSGAKKRKMGRRYGGNSFWPCGR